MSSVVNNPLLTTNVSTDLTKRDVLSKIIKLYPDEAKFLTILNKFGQKRPIHNPKFEMMEEDIEIFSTSLASDVVAGATTVTVTTGHGQYFSANDVLIFDDGTHVEQAIVSSVATDTITLTAGLTNAFTAASTKVVRGAKAVAEYGNISDSISLEPSLDYNYAQLFDESFEISLTEKETWKYYTKERAAARLEHLRSRMMAKFLRGIARTLYFGQREKRTGSSGATYLTGGLDYFITTNSQDATGLTESTFRTFLKTVTMKGSSKRILFCSGAFIEIFYDWKLADRFIPQGNDTLGFKTTSYKNDYCDLTIVMDGTLNMARPDVAYIVDPNYVGLAELIPLSKKVNAQENDKYAYKEGVYWQMGFDMANEGAFGKFINVGS